MITNYFIFYKGHEIDLNFFSKIPNFTKNKVCFILHGLFGRGKNWYSLTKSLSLESDKIFFTIDQRNHGENQQTDNISYELMVEDLVKLIEFLGIIKINLIGHSMGGKVAMLFALSYKYLVNNLIVLDIAPVTYGSENEHVIDYLLKIKLDQITSRKDADDFLKNYIADPNLRMFLLQNLKLSESGYRWCFNLFTFKKGMINLRSFPEKIKSKFLNKVLCIYGGKSNYITSENMEIYKNYFPNVEFVEIKKAGHWLHAEQPKKCVDIICKNLI